MHVPKVVQQERISHQQVEQVVEVHVPMTQDAASRFLPFFTDMTDMILEHSPATCDAT